MTHHIYILFLLVFGCVRVEGLILASSQIFFNGFVLQVFYFCVNFSNIYLEIIFTILSNIGIKLHLVFCKIIFLCSVYVIRPPFPYIVIPPYPQGIGSRMPLPRILKPSDAPLQSALHILRICGCRTHKYRGPTI